MLAGSSGGCWRSRGLTGCLGRLIGCGERDDLRGNGDRHPGVPVVEHEDREDSCDGDHQGGGDRERTDLDEVCFHVVFFWFGYLREHWFYRKVAEKMLGVPEEAGRLVVY